MQGWGRMNAEARPRDVRPRTGRPTKGRRRDEAGSGHEVVFESVSYLYLAWFWTPRDAICDRGSNMRVRHTYFTSGIILRKGRAISRVSYWKMAWRQRIK